MPRILACVSFLFLHAHSFAILPGSDPESSAASRSLVPSPGLVVEAMLAGGETHSYRFELAAEEYLSLTVEQLGIDVELALFGSDHDELCRLDSPNGERGREPLAVVADRDTDFELEVRARNLHAASARYRLKIEAKRRATSRDRALFAAQRALLEGLKLVEEWSPDARQQAAQRFEGALALAQESEDLHLEGVIFSQLSNFHRKGRDARKALEALHQSLPLWRDVGDAWAEAYTFRKIAGTHFRDGDLEQSLETLRTELGLWQEIGAPGPQAFTLRWIGLLSYRRGDIRSSLSSYYRAAILARKAGDRYALAQVLEQTGSVYSKLGDTEKALEFYQEAQALGLSTANAFTEADRLYSIGKLQELLGEDDRAYDSFVRARELWHSTQSRSGQAAALGRMSRIQRARGRTGEALSSLSEELALWQAIGDVSAEAATLVELGDLYVAENEPDRALAHHEAALALARSIADRRHEAGALMGLSRLRRRQGDLEAARELAETGLERLEALRAGIDLHELRASFVATRRGDYDFYLDLLMELHRQQPRAGYQTTAFEASERGRARSLLELVAESKIDVAADLDPALRERQEELGRRLARVQRELIAAHSREGGPEKKASASSEAELRGIEDRQQRLESEIRARHPRYAEIRYPQPLGPEEIRPFLGRGTALLEYAVGDEASYLFVVTAEQLAAFPLPPAEEISRRVDELRAALRRPGRRTLSRYVVAAQRLYDLLIAPAEALLESIDHLVVSPDGALHGLPFEALVADGGRAGHSDLSRLAFVLREWSVSYVPSASVLAALEPPHATAPATFLAFADPQYSRSGERQGGPPSVDEILVRSVFGPDGAFDFRPLPESRREAASIARLHAPDAARVYLGEEAREENVKHNVRLATARRLHFATHGLISEDRPRYSSLVLSLDESSQEDGLLQVHEIFELKLAADLVVLSACETGLGKNVRGEGIIGLTRAFFYAGAPSVVVSLWQVADRSTADLMIELYRQLGDDRTKGEALRRAKLALIDGGTFAHPYYWAPFVLQGRWQ